MAKKRLCYITMSDVYTFIQKTVGKNIDIRETPGKNLETNEEHEGTLGER